ncbi:MAG: M23 family metallopeptidase [Arcobacteraceae bacterium]
MKKDRLVITVSDINSSKSFSVNKIIKKIVLWGIVGVLLIFTISFFLISQLSTNVNNLSADREKLTKENNLYSQQIESKIAQIEELGSHIEEIEDIIGIHKDDDATLIQRATLAKLTSSEKMYMLQTIPSGCPMETCTPTSKFGWRTHPITKKKQYHNGLDLRAARRTDVRATADGVVKYAQAENKGTLGRVVMISHNFGFETAYAHLRFTDVKAGDIVYKGQLIGRSGNSGRSSGPHLHYELRHGNKILNPTSFTKWDMKNYEMIFETQRRIEWESLIKLIKSQQNKLVQQ